LRRLGDSVSLLLAGEIKELGGVQCYVSTPGVEYPKDKIILFLHDALGLGFVNNKVQETSTFLDSRESGYTALGGRFCAEWIQGEW
jgi:hypothetical protein